MVAGVTTDKVRFHRSPQWHDSTRSVSGGVVASPTELHILGDGADDDGDPEGRGGEAPDVSYVVKEFHSNRVNIDVVGVPAAGSWMVYSDVWHERWRAWVNGVPVPVYQADLAYKAVRLPGGDNDVAFRFQDAPLEAVLSGVQWNALVWLLMLIAATGLLTRNAFLATLGRTVDFDQRL